MRSLVGEMGTGGAGGISNSGAMIGPCVDVGEPIKVLAAVYFFPFEVITF